MGMTPVPPNTSPTISGKATVASSSHTNRAVKLTATADFAKASTAGEVCSGILIDDPTAGQTGTVQITGICRWEAGAAFAPEVLLATDASGRAITAVTGNYIIAKALQGATVAGAKVLVQIIHAGNKP
ncbi:MAG: DUF2190 family protein [Thermodesulfovibrionales bacterium]|nr:DUF2190 family protein [Thermodesulfovibrionales bacterium]